MARSRIAATRGILIGLVLAFSAGLVVAAVYLIHLDREVQRLYANVRWVLPAQVFAAPVELYPGLATNTEAIAHHLDVLGYRQASELQGPGTYRLAPGLIEIDERPFVFSDGPQAEARVSLRVASAAIAEIHALDGGESRDLVRLDPLPIGSIYPNRGGEDRVLVKIDEVPPLLTQTLTQVEDRNFYHHIGVSFTGMARAFFANLRPGHHTLQGGSTLTQQLIRNLFLTKTQSYSRKAREALMAILIERHISKSEILEAYLNEAWLGQDGARAVHGFGLASQFYFGKPLNELRPQEIAMLVAIVKGPSEYNPRRNPALVKERRDLVLHMMGDAGYLTPGETQLALAQPLEVVGAGGSAERFPAFVDLVKRQLAGEYREEDLTNEGLRVFTTLDPRVQEVLESRITADLPDLEKSRKFAPNTLEAAGIVTSVSGGEVQGLVGGRDLRYEGFNRAIDANRPIGSLVKPFLYLTALEQPGRYNLNSILPDEPVDLRLPNGQVWSPHNYDNQLHGPQPLFMALAKSYNLPTVHLGLDIGIEPVRKTIADAGVDGVPALPSMFLGAADMSPLDVAQIYSTLAAGGYRTPLLAIREVQTRDGQPLQHYPFKLRQALPEGPVYLVTWAMQHVITLGTARWAQSVLPPGQVFAGKTGTTEDLRDSWFAGFGADRVAVVWVGRDDNKPTGFDGAAGALRVWGRLMRDLNAKGLDTAPPQDVVTASIDAESGLLGDAGCTQTNEVPFLQGSAPQTYAACANASKSGPVDWLKNIFK